MGGRGELRTANKPPIKGGGEAASQKQKQSGRNGGVRNWTPKWGGHGEGVTFCHGGEGGFRSARASTSAEGQTNGTTTVHTGVMQA